jgi:uncharacterized protein (UPF0147 family)
MNSFKSFSSIVVIGIIFMAGACTTPPNKVVDQAQWNSRMHRLSSAMSNLTPLAANSRRFYDEQNREFIKSQLYEAAEVSGQLAADPANATNPLFFHTAKSFASEMSQAAANFDRGNQQAAQYIISNMPSHCISCHTSMDRGTRDFPISWSVNLEALNPTQKTQFYLANRQYGTALKTAQEVAKDTKAVTNDPEGWRQAIEKSLAMVVRVENDVDQVIEIIKVISENKSVPRYISRDFSVWMKDALSWKREKQKKMSTRAKYNLATSLIRSDDNDKASKNHSGLITNLRASSLLQEILLDASFSNYAEALYNAGINSEYLHGLVPWSINESYFEACIRKRPHTSIAMRCFAELESSVYKHYPNFEIDPETKAVKTKHMSELLMMAEIINPRPLDPKGYGPDR